MLSLIVDAFDVDAFICFELCEVEGVAYTFEEFGIASWRVAHAIKMPSQKVAEFALVFISVCTIAVDGWCIIVENAFNEGHGYIVLKYCEHG